MLTKTVRSRFDHPVGEKVEGCTILERHVVIPPDPVEKRRGVYDYVVEVPPAPEKSPARSARKSPTPATREAPGESYTRSTPEEMRGGGLIRRLPSR